MVYDNGIKEKVKGLYGELMLHKAYLKDLVFNKRIAILQKTGTEEQMGVSERYLGGLFGGDKDLMKKRKMKKAELKDMNSKIYEEGSKISETEQMIDDVIFKYLNDNNEEFKLVKWNITEAGDILDVIKAYQNKIDEALSCVAAEKKKKQPNFSGMIGYASAVRDYMPIIEKSFERFNTLIGYTMMKIPFEMELPDKYKAIAEKISPQTLTDSFRLDGKTDIEAELKDLDSKMRAAYSSVQKHLYRTNLVLDHYVKKVKEELKEELKITE